MDVPLEISFDNIDSSEFVEQRIRERVAKLDKLYGRLVACRVAVRQPHRQHEKGNVASVRVEMSVPGTELMVNHSPHHPKERYRDQGVYRVLDEAFDVAERRLVDYKKKRSGYVKTHEMENFLVGVVSSLRKDSDQGFLIAADGTELWFHRNAVANADLDDLNVDDRVHYVAAVGESGPQASRVWLAPNERSESLPPEPKRQRGDMS